MTVFLSLAMIALVGVQAYWFKNSIESKERQLGLLVNQALTEISSELVQNETVMTILEEIKPPLVSHQSKSVWNFHIDGRSMYSGIENGEIRLNDEIVVYSQPPASIKNQKLQMIDDSVLVILGEDELLQDTILISAMKPEEIRTELSKNLKEQEIFVDKIVRKMLLEEKGIEERITQTQVKNLLTKKLSERGIDLPFEYAVYEEGKKPIYQSDSFNEYENCKYYRASLLPGSIFRKATLISVYFPQERKHFFKSMGIMGGTSVLITLFVVTLFSLALYIIFKQKRLAEMKNDFVNNMTDEQKNLSQITRIIQTESKQLGFQVERVLQMAIFDHGQLKLKLEEIDLHDIIETVAQNFLIQLDKRGGKLEFNPEAETSVIQGDAMHLTNVVSNLMENAMKYTKQVPLIRISTRNENGTIILSVSDNGIGISKEDQKRIFDKFYRVPTGNVHNVKGFGLGLSYVKLIVEQHHGTITLKSEPEKGSRFDIHLPLQED
jgi:two-component system phosphate regulon sensor histidine kinase PhoR